MVNERAKGCGPKKRWKDSYILGGTEDKVLKLLYDRLLLYGEKTCHAHCKCSNITALDSDNTRDWSLETKERIEKRMKDEHYLDHVLPKSLTLTIMGDRIQPIGISRM